MTEFITVTVLGVLISVLGIINMMGNISTLHWYHRQRVTEENRKPFGRLVGLGTIIMGIGMIVFGVLFFISDKTGNNLFVTVGGAALIVSIVIGIILSFYAMIKYNKGIF